MDIKNAKLNISIDSAELTSCSQFHLHIYANMSDVPKGDIGWLLDSIREGGAKIISIFVNDIKTEDAVEEAPRDS